MDPAKIAAVKQWPVHTTVEDWGESLDFMSKKLLQEGFCSLQALHEYINVSVRENTQLNVKKTSLKVWGHQEFFWIAEREEAYECFSPRFCWFLALIYIWDGCQELKTGSSSLPGAG